MLIAFGILRILSGRQTSFRGKITEKPKQILSIEDLGRQDEEEVPVKGFVQVGQSRAILEKFLNRGTKEEVEAFCEAYMAQLEKDHMRSAMVRQYVVMDICIVIMSFVRNCRLVKKWRRRFKICRHRLPGRMRLAR